MPQLEGVRKTAPAMAIGAIRLDIPANNQVGNRLPKAYDRLCSALGDANLPIRGPALGRAER